MTADSPPAEAVQPQADSDTLSTALTYAWNWNDSYFKARLQALNFHVVSTAVFITAYVTCTTGRLNGLAATVACVSGLIALAFLAAERHARSRIRIGDQALIALEQQLSERLQIEAVRVTFNVRHGTARRKVRYMAVFTQAMYVLNAAAWFIAAAYSAFKA